ncbi:hypothetical protein LTR95_010579 [Oleoguttula sp. CCFEE 5521]
MADADIPIESALQNTTTEGDDTLPQQPPPTSDPDIALRDAAQPNPLPQPPLALDGATDTSLNPPPSQPPTTQPTQPSDAMDTSMSTTLPAVLPPSTHPDAQPPSTTAHKKNLTLASLLSPLTQSTPLIPDAVTAHYLTLAGLPPPPETPLPLARLLALATQKFIADIAADAYQYSRIRSGSVTSNNPLGGLGGVAAAGVRDEGGKGGGKVGGVRAGFGGGGGGGAGRTVLTMEDLGMAVGEYGVSVRRGEFYR